MKFIVFLLSSLLVTGVLTRPQFGGDEDDDGEFESGGSEDFGGDNPSSYQTDGEYVPARYGGAADTPSISSYQSNEYLPTRRKENSEGDDGARYQARLRYN
ncbi:uncharacterized protein LOC118435788 [Folsomia candida]|uniref:uncharacterized protein LOC118435788 n=1 Tax=Folsomia candida TaxID=158441 RepID=UPI0016053C35|nr:uncharacterized protein LOC118435788 [Folsomia candida]